MDSAHDSLEEIDAEELLGALAGVVSAHVVRGPTGDLVEIHILATAELHPKQVVRNVESALSAGLGIQVDRRIVSVAQIRSQDERDPATRAESSNGARALSILEKHTPADDGGDDLAKLAEAPAEPAPSGPSTAPNPAKSRLEFVRYTARRKDERCRCAVVLRTGGEEIEGSGSGPDTDNGRAEAAARAVFDAIGHARPEIELALTGVSISRSRDRSFVIVSAQAVMDRSSVPLVGAAQLARSPEEGAILAALQASNRWSG